MYLDITFDDIENYFINKDIVINDQDEIQIKIKKYLLRYKRLIGSISLIILLIIGYYCFLDNSNSYNNENSLQLGGAGGPSDADIESAKNKMMAEQMAKQQMSEQQADEQKAKADQEKADKTDSSKVSASMKTKRDANKALKKAAKEQSRKEMRAKDMAKLKAFGADPKHYLKKGAVGTLKGAYGVGAYAAETFKDNASWFYGIIYAIAAFVALSLIILPSFAFLVIGIVCYFLLKDKMRYFKSL